MSAAAKAMLGVAPTALTRATVLNLSTVPGSRTGAAGGRVLVTRAGMSAVNAARSA